jgi:hypothetical protein
MESIYCRICWNTARWKRPTGDACLLETRGNKKPEKQSWVRKTGFGHEEWLFNFDWEINGHHYSYLQPMKSPKFKGATYRIITYTINEIGRYFVAEIQKCSVISEDESREIYRIYEENGWLETMRGQIGNVLGKMKEANFMPYSDPLELLNTSNSGGLFNIKFATKDVHFFFYLSHMLAHIPRNHILYRSSWYKPHFISSGICDQELERIKKKAESYIMAQRFSPEKEIILKHNEIQNGLAKYLNDREFRVATERNYVDLQIIENDGLYFFEVKSYANARQCMRIALGQLIEYQYYSSENVKHLFIVGESRATPSDIKYVNFLNNKFKLPISYICFDTKSCVIDKGGSCIHSRLL